MRNKYHASETSLAVPPSRVRSLLRDVARGIGQQMYFWGCDVRHPRGNLLSRFGLERIARTDHGGEGSSRYCADWQEGTVELHSFCIGWYPHDPGKEGAIFIRSHERLNSCKGGMPLTPGEYEPERLTVESADQRLEAVRPLVSWIVSYEDEIAPVIDDAYRQRCWMQYLAKPGARPWLPPAQARRWFSDFLTDPLKTPRPRDLLRSSRRATPPAPFGR